MLHFEDPFILIATAMILSLLLALFVYYKDSRFKEASIFIRILMLTFRFISIAIILLFVFNPKWVNNLKRTEKPIIVFLQDASSSILNYEDSIYYKTEFLNLIHKNNKDLAQDFEVYNYHFSESLEGELSETFTGKTTDISNALQKVEDLFYNRNLAAIVLASDGNYTKGLEPLYTVNKLNVPVFTLALGDSSIQRDVAINEVNFNEIAYLDNEFPIAFELYSNFQSDEKQHLQIHHKGNLVYEEWLRLEANLPLKKELLIEATHEGIQYYELSISSFNGEKNTQNNHFSLAIEILNNTQNILILSGTPHPDIAALKSALEIGENYKVTTSLFYAFIEELEAYNLIILHQIPEFANRNASLLTKIKESNISILYITGEKTKWNKFNEVQDLLSLKTSHSNQKVFPILNENFTPFDLSEDCKKFVSSCPPLLAPFGEQTVKTISHSLFKQKIEGINTSDHLFVFAEQDDKITAVFLSEGLWKWKLFDYQKNKTHDNFNELIQSTSQYLTLNKDKRKLRLHYSKLNTQGDAFKLNAQLYNDNYKLIDNAELSLSLINEEQDEYVYTLNNKGTNYNLLLDNLSEGNYQFVLQSTYKNETLKQQGSFAIIASTIEQQKLEANWNLLHKMSIQTNGSFIQKEQFSTYAKLISAKVSAKPEIYFSKQLSDLIKQKTIFFVLLLSLFFEWALRKKLGTH